MRAIFTYPNNPFYIDPDYLGDDTSGFQRRIKELKDGTYLDWGTALAPSKSVDEIMEYLGEYYDYYDSVGNQNISRNDMWKYPLVELELELIPSREPISFETVSSYPTLNSSGKPFALYKFTTATAHNFQDGDHIVCPGGNDVPKVGTTPQAQFAEGYANNVTTTEWEVWGDTGGTIEAPDFIPTQLSVDEIVLYTHPSNAFFGPNMGLHCPNGDTGLLSNGDALKMSQAFDNSNWSGDGADLSEKYVEIIDANYIRLYEDSALTIPTTVTPEFILANIPNDNIGVTPTQGPFTKQLTGIPFSGDLNTKLKQITCYGQSGQQRVRGYVTLSVSDAALQLSNLSTGVVDGGIYFSTTGWSAPRYNEQIWVEVDAGGNSMTCYDAETGGNILEFTATNTASSGVPDVYWTVNIPMPALDRSPNSCTVDEQTWFKYETGSTAGGDEFWQWWRRIEVTGNSAPQYEQRYQYKTPNVIIPATNTYKHIIPDPITQPVIPPPPETPITVNGMQFGDYASRPGQQGSTLRSVYEGTEYEAPIWVFTQNTEGQLQSISATRYGVFEPTTTPLRWQNHVDPLPDTYVPPAPTPVEIAAAEDNFDTNDEWDNNPTNYDYNRQKTWPLFPTPRSAELTETTPSTTTQSQNGIKYVRSGGFTKWGIDLEYPPLTEEEFRELQVTSQLAKGQKAVFRWYWTNKTNPSEGDIANNTGEWIWKRNWTSNRVPTIVSWSNNEKTVLVEGYESNESAVVKKGQMVSVGSSYNGEPSQTVSETDANVFGEAKFRINFKPGNWFLQPGSYSFMTINNFAVTLAEDDFVYKVRADGLYDVSVRFDLDWYHD